VRLQITVVVEGEVTREQLVEHFGVVQQWSPDYLIAREATEYVQRTLSDALAERPGLVGHALVKVLPL